MAVKGALPIGTKIIVDYSDFGDHELGIRAGFIGRVITNDYYDKEPNACSNRIKFTSGEESWMYDNQISVLTYDDDDDEYVSEMVDAITAMKVLDSDDSGIVLGYNPHTDSEYEITINPVFTDYAGIPWKLSEILETFNGQEYTWIHN